MIVNDTNGYQYNTAYGEEYGPTLYAAPRRDKYGRTTCDTLWFVFLANAKPWEKRREDWFIGAIK